MTISTSEKLDFLKNNIGSLKEGLMNSLYESILVSKFSEKYNVTCYLNERISYTNFRLEPKRGFVLNCEEFDKIIKEGFGTMEDYRIVIRNVSLHNGISELVFKPSKGAKSVTINLGLYTSLSDSIRILVRMVGGLTLNEEMAEFLRIDDIIPTNRDFKNIDLDGILEGISVKRLKSGKVVFSGLTDQMETNYETIRAHYTGYRFK